MVVIGSAGRGRLSGHASLHIGEVPSAVLVGPIADAVKVKVANSTQYFSVGGDTAREILASLETNSPRQEEHRRAALRD